MTLACLVDTTRCIGCRSCQVACKQWNDLPGEAAKFSPVGYQNPPNFSAHTRTFVSYHEREVGGRVSWHFVKRQCMHCSDMPCANNCAPKAFRLTRCGTVVTEPAKCIGCVACIDDCPFDVPRVEVWEVETPHLRKCDFCFQRRRAEVDGADLNGAPLAGRSLWRYRRGFAMPACVKACPTGALRFGRRDLLLKEARRRMAAEPGKYVRHIYGEKELGGLGWLYLASVPFEELGFPTRFAPRETIEEMGAVDREHPAAASLLNGIGTLLAGACWFFRRRGRIADTESRNRT